jgi:amino acid adenylation domain-containing protein
MAGRNAAAELVARCEAKGARFSVEGERIDVIGAGSLDDGERSELTCLKPAILRLLLARDAQPEMSGHEGPVALSSSQARMWAHVQLDPDTRLYHLPAAWWINGPLDTERLRTAFATVVERQSAMRARIARDGDDAVQYFDVDVPPLEVKPLRGDPTAAIAGETCHAFDFEKGPLFKACLLRDGVARHILFFMPHHLIWDGQSFDIFLRELTTAYAGEQGGGQPAQSRLGFGDFCTWQKAKIEHGGFDIEVAHARAALSTPPAPLDLPGDRPRPAWFVHDGGEVGVAIDRGSYEALRRVADTNRVTPAIVLLLLWRVFLTRITRSTDFSIGVVTQARPGEGFEDVAGCFVNVTHEMRCIDLSMSLDDVIRNHRADVTTFYDLQETPETLIVDAAAPARDPSRTPLSQVMFSHQRIGSGPTLLGEAALEQIDIPAHATPVELLLSITEDHRGLRAGLHYSTGTFSEGQAGAIAESLATFIKECVERPSAALDRVSLIGPGAGTLLEDLNDTSVPIRGVTSIDHIEDRTQYSPDHPAIICGETTLSYRQLLDRADAYAASLIEHGVRRGQIVGLGLPRATEQLAALLGIWRAGAAYLPLDPALPLARRALMVDDTAAAVILSPAEDKGLFGENRIYLSPSDIEDMPGPVERLPVTAPADLAYVLFTSGSTGRPKGVRNSHAAIANFLSSMADSPGFSESDRLLAVTTLAFDISILELLLPVMTGGTVVLATEDEARDGALLAELMDRHDITMMQGTPATWRLLIDSGWPGKADLTALCGGEPLDQPLAAALLERCSALWNMYGPTETTVWSTCKRIEDPERITVGRPIANTQVHIVDENGHRLPPGLAGELIIGGEGVADGYHQREELTNERFIADPFAETGRLYRTGDRARITADGEIEILGRDDAQVKIRGYRVELGEIEACLDRHEAIAKSVAAVVRDRSGQPALALYFQPADDEPPTGSELRRFARRTLPDYMIPQFVLPIDKLPLTPSGKIDRQNLPPIIRTPDSRLLREPPQTEMEQHLATIWARVLGTEDIARSDNFFELGGQSLQAAQMVGIARRELGLKMQTRAVIFETLAQLAADL